MQTKLRLVRDTNEVRERASAVQEDRYRYPAHEEIWEVSCGSDRQDKAKPTLVPDHRRAS
jgi:hypothetical protein